MKTDLDTLWNLPRSTSPQRWYEEIVPDLPLVVPAIDVPWPVAYHVDGSGGGIWTATVAQGRVQVVAGLQGTPIVQLRMGRSDLRELLSGFLRDRLRLAVERLGVGLDLHGLPAPSFNPARLERLAELHGSIGIEIRERRLGDSARFVVTFGAGAPAWESPTTQLTIDADELVEWIVRRVHPRQILMSGRVRLVGEVALPTRALGLLLGD